MLLAARQSKVNLKDKQIWGESTTVSGYSLKWWKYRNETESAPNSNENYLKLSILTSILQLGRVPLNHSNCLNNSYMMVGIG